jgi:hypothetical protein
MELFHSQKRKETKNAQLLFKFRYDEEQVQWIGRSEWLLNVQIFHPHSDHYFANLSNNFSKEQQVEISKGFYERGEERRLPGGALWTVTQDSLAFRKVYRRWRLILFIVLLIRRIRIQNKESRKMKGKKNLPNFWSRRRRNFFVLPFDFFTDSDFSQCGNIRLAKFTINFGLRATLQVDSKKKNSHTTEKKEELGNFLPRW